MSLQPRPGIEQLEICPHGGINYAELKAIGLKAETILDFSVCTNPFMPPPEVANIMGTIPIERYPDSESTELRQQLSQRLGIPAEHILAGSGTTELIRLVALAYFRQKDPVLLLEPTYGEYEVACRLVGAEPVKIWGKAEDNFAPGIEEVSKLLRKRQFRAVFICNPNNPTGKYLSRQEIETVSDAIEDGLLILDEAYISFVGNSWDSVELVAKGNVVILRSMTKDYGLAGLRLGYAIASQEVINNLRRVCPPWNVNAIAQKIGAIVLKDNACLDQSKRKIIEAKQFLIDELSRLGYQLLPSDANYFLVKVGDAAGFRASLLRQGILVRDCASFGLSEYVRIAPRTMPECHKLMAAIQHSIDNLDFSQIPN